MNTNRAGGEGAIPHLLQDNVSRVVKTLLTAHAQTQGDIAESLGMTQAAVSNKIAGKTRWSLDDIERLSAHFGVPAPVLLDDARNLIGGDAHRPPRSTSLPARRPASRLVVAALPVAP